MNYFFENLDKSNTEQTSVTVYLNNNNIK